MAKIAKYTTISRILSKYKRDLDMKKISISDIVEWTGEALEFIGIGIELDAVSFLKVENNECQLPESLTMIKGILYDSQYSGIHDCFIMNKEYEVKEETPSRFEKPICIGCDGSPINESWISYSKPFIRDSFRQALDLLTRGNFNPSNNNRFQRIKASNRDMFHGLFCYDEFKSCEKEYKIKSNGILEFSFKEGQVAIAYNYYPLDCDGYPMIPDHISFTSAVTAYITYKIIQGDFYNYVPNSGSRLKVAELDWNWRCKQASNEVMMPDEEELEDINKSWRGEKEKGFYGRLGFRKSN